MFASINTLVRRQRRRLALVTAVVALAGVVVLAHSAMGADHMDDGAVMCVAVLQIAAFAAVAAVALGRGPLLRVSWPRLRFAVPALALVVTPPQPRARAGPSSLQVFRL